MARNQLDRPISPERNLPRYLADSSLSFDRLTRWVAVDMRHSSCAHAFAIYDFVVVQIASRTDELFTNSNFRDFLRAARAYNRLQRARNHLLRRWNTRARCRARVAAILQTYSGGNGGYIAER